MVFDEKPLVNRVAESSLVTFNLEEYFPKAPIIGFDLKDFLFQGLILKEKDFRAALKEYQWSKLQDGYIALHCSTDAIIPTWAFMLVAAYATPYAKEIFMGNTDALLQHYYSEVLNKLNLGHLSGCRVVIKGCSNKPVPASAYVDLTAKLQPLAQSIMYGEPCSTVPIFKRPRELTTKS